MKRSLVRWKPPRWSLEDAPPADFTQLPGKAIDQLRAHGELRAYYRKIGYEMPQLESYKKPFTPPPPNALRFTRTWYAGEEHPAARKVRVEVPTAALNLSQVEERRLILLAGPRYDPETKCIAYSSEIHGDRESNKAYLLEQLRRLLNEAKTNEDGLEDLPLDFRHVESSNKKKKKKKSQRYTFPQHWLT